MKFTIQFLKILLCSPSQKFTFPSLSYLSGLLVYWITIFISIFFSALYYKPQRVKSFKQKQKLAAIVLLANFLRAIWSKQELCSHQGQLEQKMGMLAYEQALVFRPGARVAKEKTLAHMPKQKANK